MQRHALRTFLVAASLIASPAMAMTDIEAYKLSSNLATILAAEAACGLTYDQAAIANYITANVPADRLDFAPMLQAQVVMAAASLSDMSTSSKTAHCTTITKSAQHLGFIK